MYTCETLRKYRELADAYLQEYMNAPLDTLRVHVSMGNSKIGHCMNVSTLAGYTCGNCGACLIYCYDIKACIRFPETVLRKRAENTALLLRDRREFFRQIKNKLHSYRGKYRRFRWHQAGEIPGLAYLSEMNDVARKFPKWRFWTYTKMYDIVNSYCDSNGGRDAVEKNLSIMFSPWDGIPCPNPYGFGEFITVMKGQEEPKGMFRCVGNCDWCNENGRGCPFNETAWNKEH